MHNAVIDCCRLFFFLKVEKNKEQKYSNITCCEELLLGLGQPQLVANEAHEKVLKAAVPRKTALGKRVVWSL